MHAFNLRSAVAAAAAATVASCGGGDSAGGGNGGPGGTPPPPPPLPVQSQLGIGFARIFGMAPTSEPSDPQAGDVVAVSLTADPFDVPNPM